MNIGINTLFISSFEFVNGTRLLIIDEITEEESLELDNRTI